MSIKHYEVLKFITTLRESDKYIETIYLNGGCYQFYLVLKSLYPEAEPFITPTKDHIVTYIGGVYYDIRGIYEESTVLNIPVDMLEDIKMWNFASTMMLSIGECAYCEEPYLIPVDLSHLTGKEK